MVFGFSLAGNLLDISKHNVQKITPLVVFRCPNLDKDLMEEGDDEYPTEAPTIPVPIFSIGNAKLRGTVTQVI